ncbi:MAG: ABC transporter permease [Bdellovibrionota bacterium]
MKQFIPIFKREFLGYFRSPVAYVFMVIFLLASMGFTFFIGSFYESNQASLQSFFVYLPWLYLVLVPAVGMRLWAEERKSGTIELLFTLPVTMLEAVLAKFAAGWAFLGISLLLTFSIIITVNYLGDPDNGVIAAGYFGSFLMAGSFLGITCWTSAMTKNQVVSFILSVVICFVLVLLGWGVFTNMMANFLPAWLIDLISSFGFMSHYSSISKGLIDPRDLIYFLSVIVISLALNKITLEAKKAS